MKKHDAVSNFHWIEIEHEQPEWSDELEPCFKYRGDTYFLSEFMRFNFTNSNYNGYWDGYLQTSNFGGLVVKIHDTGDAVQVGRS